MRPSIWLFSPALICLSGCANQVELTGLNVGSSVAAPSSANVPANGLTSATLSVQLATDDGAPLSGLNVRFQTQHCSPIQPVQTTDANGVVSGSISCSHPGRETVQLQVNFNDATATLPQTATINFFSPGDGQQGVVAGLALDAQAVVHNPNSSTFAANYTGTITFVSTDPQASLPADYLFTATDRGYHRWEGGLTLRTTGTQTVQVLDRATRTVLYSETYRVIARPAQGLHLALSQQTVAAGIPLNVTLTAVDSLGNAINDYVGTVSLYSSDTTASLSPPIVFSPIDQGSKTINAGAVLRAVGGQTISAQDSSTPPLVGAASLQVLSGPATQLVFAQMSENVVAGAPVNLVLEAADPYGNLDSAYTGAALLSTSDPAMTLPTSVTLDNGRTTLSDVRFATAGITTLTAQSSDPNVQSVQQTLDVAPGAAVQLTTLLPTTAQAGQSVSLLVQATDAYGNPDPTYRGTVDFSSDDPNAIVPGTYTFNPNDAGVHSFPSGLELQLAGLRTVTSSDVANALQPGSGTCTVQPAGLVAVGVRAPGSAVAGSNFALQVAGVDPYGNTVPTFTGTVTLATSDANATLSSSATISSGGAVTVPGGATLRTAGSQTITATDTTGVLPAGIGTVQIAAAPLSQLILAPLPTKVSIGTVLTPVVSGADAYGNPTPTYTGTVTFLSSDPCAALPPAYEFAAADAGMHTYVGDLVLNSLGTQHVSVADDQNHTTGQSFTVIHGCGPFGASELYDPFALNDYLGNLGVTIDPNGQPWLMTLAYPGPWSIAAIHWTGKQWDNSYNLTSTGASLISASGNLNNAFIAMGADGSPAIAWNDNSSVRVSRLVGTTWEGYTGGHAATTPFNGTVASLRIAAGSTTPWVLWYSGSKLEVAYFDGTQWQLGGGTGIVPNSTGATSADLAVDANQVAYVSFTNNPNGTEQVYVSVLQQGTWTDLAGSSTGNGISNNAGGSAYCRIAVDAQSRVTVAWSDARTGTRQVYLAQFAGGTWNELAGSASGGGVSQAGTINALVEALAIDHESNPVLVWFAYTSNDSYTSLRVARYSGTSWNILTNPSGALGTFGSGSYVGLGVDLLDKPVVFNTLAGYNALCSLY